MSGRRVGASASRIFISVCFFVCVLGIVPVAGEPKRLVFEMDIGISKKVPLPAFFAAGEPCGEKPWPCLVIERIVVDGETLEPGRGTQSPGTRWGGRILSVSRWQIAELQPPPGLNSIARPKRGLRTGDDLWDLPESWNRIEVEYYQRDNDNNPLRYYRVVATRSE